MVVAELLAVAVVLSLVVGQALGTPAGLSYVETGSMAPTMEPGDVVVFRAERTKTASQSTVSSAGRYAAT